MSAPSSSNAVEEEQASRRQIAPELIDSSLQPVSANNEDRNYMRRINPNPSPISAAYTDQSSEHYRKNAHAHSGSTPVNFNIADEETTSSMPHEVMSMSDAAGVSRQRSTIVSSEQINHCMASTELGNSPPKRKSYPCPICQKSFRSGQSLGGHMNSHRNANANSRQEIDQEPGPSSQLGVEVPTYRGVRNRKEKWVAEIRPPKSPKTVWLGTFESEKEAAYVYDAAIYYFVTGSPLNFEARELYQNISKVPAGLPNKQCSKEIRKVIKDVARRAMEEDRIRSEAAQTVNAGGDEPGLLDHHVDASIPSTSGSTPPARCSPISSPTGVNVQEEDHASDDLDDHADLSSDVIEFNFPPIDDSDLFTNFD